MKRPRKAVLSMLLVLACLTVSAVQDAPPPRDGSPRVVITPSRGGVGVTVNPGALISGLFASRSERPEPANGDAFAAVLPAAPRPGPTSPGEVLAQIEPILRSVGFRRDLSDLALPAQASVLSGADVRGLALEICRDEGLPGGERLRAVCAALREGGQPSRLADDAIRDAYGVELLEWKADLERPRHQYVFTQTVDGVPIERAMVEAVRRDGETVSMVHGALYDSYKVANRADPSQRDRVLETARARLASDVGTEISPAWIGEPALVLLPGEAVKGRRVLRHAWRVVMGARQSPKSWMVWADAATGELLQVAPQWSEAAVTVKAGRWRRDPGLCTTGGACIEPVRFKVDPLPNGKLALQLAGVFPQVDVGADGILPSVEIEAASAADFLQNPIAGQADALCAKGGNRLFRQVNAYSHVYSFRETARSAEPIPDFPEKSLQVYIDVSTDQGSFSYYDSADGRDSKSSLWIAEGQGHASKNCPNQVDLRLNGAQDATILAHETAHLLTWRLQERRPQSWCKSGTCPLPDPRSHGILHGFADGLAALYAGTNCFAGWSAKNLGGTDARLSCKVHDEDGGFPRLAELPADRFPEHRLQNHVGEYANGQIAAAALWDLRQAMLGKAGEAGVLDLWVRLLRSLRSFGFQKITCSSNLGAGWDRLTSCDRDVFLQLQDLERAMLAEWTAVPGPGRQVASKALSSWAKTGVFLTPIACLDGKADTKHALCPAADTAVDAVIEIADDSLQRNGQPPRFRIWTGPGYVFAPNGAAAINNDLCGRKYEVEVASDSKFSKNLWKSGVQPTATCRADLALAQGAWDTLRAGSRLYYRVTSWDQKGLLRISTSPGAGAFTIDPPFAAINATGEGPN